MVHDSQGLFLHAQSLQGAGNFGLVGSIVLDQAVGF